MSGGKPGIDARRPVRCASSRGTERIRPTVYGWLGFNKIVLFDAISALVFTPLVIYLGYTFAPTLESITSVTGKIHDTGVLVLFLLVLGLSFIFFLFRFIWVKKKNHEGKNTAIRIPR